MPPLHRGGAIIAALSLLQPRPTHRQTFRRLGEGERWSKRFGRSTGIWEEVYRLRTVYPVSTNNIVVFLGLLEGLGGVLDVLWVSSRPGKTCKQTRSKKEASNAVKLTELYIYRRSLVLSLCAQAA